MNLFSSFTRRNALLLAAALGAGTLFSGCYVEETHAHGRVYHDPYAGGAYYHDRGYHNRTVYERRGNYNRDVYVTGNTYSRDRAVVRHPRRGSTTTVVTPEVTVRRY